MVYSYLLDLYKEIEARKNAITAQATNKPDGNMSDFYRGRIAALEEFLHFLQENYHSKLPKRYR